MSDSVRVETHGHVLVVTLNKPKVNAIDHEMSKAIADAFVEFNAEL